MSETLGHTDNLEISDKHRLQEHLTGIIVSNDAELEAMQPEISHLMEVCHKLYNLPRTFFDAARPTTEQMYDEPTYNDVFVYGYDPRANIKEKDEKGNELPSERISHRAPRVLSSARLKSIARPSMLKQFLRRLAI